MAPTADVTPKSFSFPDLPPLSSGQTPTKTTSTLVASEVPSMPRRATVSATSTTVTQTETSGVGDAPTQPGEAANVSIITTPVSIVTSGKPPDGYAFVISQVATTRPNRVEADPLTTQVQSANDNNEFDALHTIAARYLDTFYIEFQQSTPNVAIVASFISYEDRATYQTFYETIASQGDRWKFPPNPVEILVFQGTERIDETNARLRTCELSNAIRYREHDPNSSVDNEVIQEGLHSFIKTQRWTKEQGQSVATIDVDRQVLEGDQCVR
jgi:hypothetical protein